MPSAVSKITALLMGAWLFTSVVHAGETHSADVIVYGSTPGGFCAAIAAAREGASVILLEPTGHIGGMNTGGLSFSDSNQMYRDTLMGLFHEWHVPGTGDGTPGGTSGTLLISAAFDVEAIGQTIAFDDTPAFRAAVSDALAGDGFLRLILRGNDETTGTHHFARFSDETVTPAVNRPELRVVTTQGARAGTVVIVR